MSLKTAFTLSLVFLVVGFVIPFRLTTFAPFLVLCLYATPFDACLWIALGSGLVLDLTSSAYPFGFHAAAYCLTVCFLYDKQRFFFVDEPTTVPVMTFFLSAMATGVQALLLSFLGRGIPLSWEWVFFDLACLPLLDGLYGFICFTLPSVLLGRRRRPVSSTPYKRPQ